MRHGQALAALLLAVCLCGAGVRAQGAAAPTAAPGMAGIAALLTGGVQPALGGMGAAMQGSMASWKAAAASSLSAFGAGAQGAGAQAEAALAAFESQYCTPATFTPSKKKPATFVGHSMAITFSMGNCTFNESKWIHDDVKELECVQPSLSYTKSPANFTSKYHTAPVFKSKECKVTKTFGEPVEKVLFVFDGTQAPDITSLTAQITQEVQQLLGTVGGGLADLIGHSKGLIKGALGGSGAAPSFVYQ